MYAIFYYHNFCLFGLKPTVIKIWSSQSSFRAMARLHASGRLANRRGARGPARGRIDSSWIFFWSFSLFQDKEKRMITFFVLNHPLGSSPGGK